MTHARIAVAAFAGLLLACSETVTMPPASSPEAPAASTPVRGYIRLLTDAQTQIANKTRSDLKIAGTGSSSALSALAGNGNICSLFINPPSFNLDVTGQAGPSSGSLALSGWYCDGTFANPNPYLASWTSSNSSVVSVSAGFVVAHAAGQATICAYIDGGSACASATVLAAPVLTRVAVSPGTAAVLHGGTVQFTAQAYDQYGYALGAVPFSWTTSNSAVATVNASGLATGISFGVATITACAGGQCASSTISVDPLKVSINGPNAFIRERDYTFSASGSGGRPPYSYIWYESHDGGATYYGVATGPSYTRFGSPDEDLYLQAMISDSGGATAVATKHIVAVPR